jgi:hypothetical protein
MFDLVFSRFGSHLFIDGDLIITIVIYLYPLYTKMHARGVINNNKKKQDKDYTMTTQQNTKQKKKKK